MLIDQVRELEDDVKTRIRSDELFNRTMIPMFTLQAPKFLEIIQDLIAVDDILKEVERLDAKMPKKEAGENEEYHTIIVARIRKAIESTGK